MRALLNDDLITSLTDSADGVEIGNPPAGVGLERLRWTGESLVDLAECDRCQVVCRDGRFELHAVPVPGSQEVVMRWTDRKRLVLDGETIRLLTPSELAARNLAEENGRLKARLRVALREQVGDRDDQIADLAKLVALLMSVVVRQDQAALTELINIEQQMTALYHPSETGPVLLERASVLASVVSTYYGQKKPV